MQPPNPQDSSAGLKAFPFSFSSSFRFRSFDAHVDSHFRFHFRFQFHIDFRADHNGQLPAVRVAGSAGVTAQHRTVPTATHRARTVASWVPMPAPARWNSRNPQYGRVTRAGGRDRGRRRGAASARVTKGDQGHQTTFQPEAAPKSNLSQRQAAAKTCFSHGRCSARRPWRRRSRAVCGGRRGPAAVYRNVRLNMRLNLSQLDTRDLTPGTYNYP